MIDHGYAADEKDAAAKGVAAGVEMEMGDDIYFDNIKALLAEKKITREQIDDAVRNILRVKYRWYFENHMPMGGREEDSGPVLP
jgi:beta-glucosidase